MNLYLYNSLTRKKELFEPIDESNVKMYVCGPTVYDFAHIGNARAIVVFDLLFRVLSHKYKKVTYVRNITDIDDKICNKSLNEKCNFYEISQRFNMEFQKDMKSLNTLEPTHQPLATEFVQNMINMISDLINKGFAYEADGHVLFDVSKYESYGKLSKKDKEELIAGARIEIADYKESPEDFVLWKPSPQNMPGWDSPWGIGRPGWHIECSAMSKHYLGDFFDIHGGGIDLIFPHHENERAQSCCANDTKEMANFWIHNGHLMVEGKKMSKSLGNFFTVRELLDKYNPEAIRLTLIGTHYRQPLDWTENLINMSKQILNKWYRIIEKFENHVFFSDNKVFDEFYKNNVDAINETSKDFVESLHDDLNTPNAIHHFSKMLKELDEEGTDIILASVLYCKNFIGLLDQKSYEWFKYISNENITEEKIEQLIAERAVARKEKNFALSDKIRNELQNNGIQIEDSPSGTTWRKI